MYNQILKTIIFLQIVFLSYTLNYLNERKTCKHLQTEKGLRHFLLFHHFIAVFIFMGWILLPDKILYSYIYFTLGILLHWKFNDNRCVFTDLYYHMCGKLNYFKVKNPRPFRDILWQIGLNNSRTRTVVYNLVVALGIIKCIYYKLY